MALNKLALIRYKTIDDCLRNRFRKWTLEDLIAKVSEVLYDREGIVSGVSRRTIQADIQLMRSDKLGYNAPITVVDKKYYTYGDKDFTIMKAPVNPADVEKMKEIVSLLKQFNGFSYVEEMSSMIARLENNLHRSSHDGRSYIQFEHNNLLKGLEHISPLYQAILNSRSLTIAYKSFKAAAAQEGIYYPYLLKEYRNRWFLICRIKSNGLLTTLALDRIIAFRELPDEPFMAHTGPDFDEYYSDLLGVTKTEKDKAYKIVLEVDSHNAPYVLTKPLHQSQTLIRETEHGIIIRIEVVPNFELEREILGFGECMKVLAPRFLAMRIRKRLSKAYGRYGNEAVLVAGKAPGKRG